MKNYFPPRKSYYSSGLGVVHARRLRLARSAATVGFPSAYAAFVACFFAAGMSFYDGDTKMGK